MLTVIVMSFFESVVRDHSNDHPVTVAHVRSDTLSEFRTPLLPDVTCAGLDRRVGSATVGRPEVGVPRPWDCAGQPRPLGSPPKPEDSTADVGGHGITNARQLAKPLPLCLDSPAIR